MSDIFNIKDLFPYHGDEDFDPRSDLSQGRGDDAEHPSIIPMDASTSPSTPRGPMTRARSKAIEDKVNSLLSEIPLSTQETWLLPQTETLCVIRYIAEEETTGVNSLDSPELPVTGTSGPPGASGLRRPRPARACQLSG